MITWIIIAIVVVTILAAAVFSYKKVGPNEVLIVTGGMLHGPYVQENESTHTKVKVVKGGGTWVWPFVQQAEVQSLDTFNIPVTVEDIMTKDMVPVDVRATALLRVGSDPELIAIASEKTLGLDEKERDDQLTEIVKGGVREVLSGLTPMEANQRASFQDAVINAISDTFANLGLEITKLTITSISDKNGYFQSLYAKDVADKQASARQAQAEADKRASLTETRNDQETKEAQLAADREIASHQRDTDVAKAQFSADVEKQNAIADRAHDIADAEQQAIIAQKQIEVNKNQYEATTLTQARANAQKVQIDADAQSKQKRTLADADAYKTTKDGEANANKIEKVGAANASAQEAVANALKENGKDALTMKLIEILPDLVTASAKAMSSIDNLTVFNGSKGMMDSMNMPLAQSLDLIKKSTNLDVVDLLKQQARGTRTINGSVPVKEENE